MPNKQNVLCTKPICPFRISWLSIRIKTNMPNSHFVNEYKNWISHWQYVFMLSSHTSAAQFKEQTLSILALFHIYFFFLFISLSFVWHFRFSFVAQGLPGKWQSSMEYVTANRMEGSEFCWLGVEIFCRSFFIWFYLYYFVYEIQSTNVSK